MIKLTGIIVPADWNENGIPLEFAISTSDERIYPLRRQKGLKVSLKSLLQREVEITGSFNEEDGIKVFFVSSYTIIKRKKATTAESLHTSN